MSGADDEELPKSSNYSWLKKLGWAVLLAIGLAALGYASVASFGIVPIVLATVVWASGGVAVGAAGIIAVKHAKDEGWFVAVWSWFRKKKQELLPPAGSSLEADYSMVNPARLPKRGEPGYIQVTFNFTPDSSPARSPAATPKESTSNVIEKEEVDLQFPLRNSKSLRRKWSECRKNNSAENDAASYATSSRALASGVNMFSESERKTSLHRSASVDDLAALAVDTSDMRERSSSVVSL